MRLRCEKSQQRASPTLPSRYFATDRVSSYTDARSYSDFDTFAGRMIANMRFNGYTEEAVLAPDVRRRFAEAHATHSGKFDQPVRIDYFCP